MGLIKGNMLTSTTRAEVLRSFIYRWTCDNTRRNEVYANISKPTIPLITDAQWLSEHAFHVRCDGKLMRNRRHAVPAFLAE